MCLWNDCVVCSRDFLSAWNEMRKLLRAESAAKWFELLEKWGFDFEMIGHHYLWNTMSTLEAVKFQTFMGCIQSYSYAPTKASYLLVHCSVLARTNTRRLSQGWALGIKWLSNIDDAIFSRGLQCSRCLAFVV